MAPTDNTSRTPPASHVQAHGGRLAAARPTHTRGRSPCAHLQRGVHELLAQLHGLVQLLVVQQRAQDEGDQRLRGAARRQNAVGRAGTSALCWANSGVVGM